MAITHDDIKDIQDILDNRYVQQSDCNERHEKINGMLANDDKRIELIFERQEQYHREDKSGLRFNNWLTAAVLVAIIGGVIAFYFLG